MLMLCILIFFFDSPTTFKESRSTLPISDLDCLGGWRHEGILVDDAAAVATDVATMLEFKPRCKLDIRNHIHFGLEKSLVPEGILEGSERDDMIFLDIIIVEV